MMATNTAVFELDGYKLMSQLTFTVKVKHRWGVRVGLWLMRLGATIARAHAIEVEYEP
jgi:hypothetical protein